MLVQNWMTSEAIYVTPDTSLLKMGKLMRDKKISRLPVVDEDERVVGIVSDRDVSDASPSKATSLDMYEMHYLLAGIKARDIMTPKPVTISPIDTVEKAAMILLDRKISGLPVVEESGRLVGVISEHDVFKALVAISGAREGGIQVGMELPNEPGTMRPVFDLLRAKGCRILSVLSSNIDEGKENGLRHVFVRLRSLASKEEEEAVIEAIREKVKVLYWTRNTTHLS